MKFIYCLVILFPVSCQAAGVDDLKLFFKNTNTLSASFHQLVLDAQGKKVQETDGLMQLLRPGKFRWDYTKPYQQQIIGDGEKVWLYDPDLNQVTVRSLNKALGSSPATLLAGTKEIEKTFVMDNVKRSDDVNWVSAIPVNKESGFEKILLGFKDDQLSKMEVYDNFAHITYIEFKKIERNLKIAPQIFKFTVPSNADVVEE